MYWETGGRGDGRVRGALRREPRNTDRASFELFGYVEGTISTICKLIRVCHEFKSKDDPKKVFVRENLEMPRIAGITCIPGAGVTQVEPRDPAIARKRARERPEARIDERNGTKKSKEETHSQSERRPLTEEKMHRGGLRGRRRERRRGRRRKGGNERVVHAMVEENVRGVGDVVHRYV